jgi:hypothetical protein
MVVTGGAMRDGVQKREAFFWKLGQATLITTGGDRRMFLWLAAAARSTTTTKGELNGRTKTRKNDIR